MYKLKLIKALSYSGVVKASVEHPFVETDDQAIAEAAIATGYFELINKESLPEEVVEEISKVEDMTVSELEDEVDNDGDSDDETEELEGKALEDMTVSELETFATYKEISLKGIKSKAEKIEKLCADLGISPDTKVVYGSPTMVELETN